MNNIECDIVIVGTGIAGLSCALGFQDNTKIIIISNNNPGKSGSTRFAQGGIAFSENDGESTKAHIYDTINAGSGMCDKTAVHHFIEQSNKTIKWLEKQGVNFDKREDGTIQKGLEGGHSENRIAHIGGDATGIGIINALFEKISSKDNISFIKGELSALLTDDNNTVCGIEAEGFTIKSSSVIFATGGGCGIFGDRTAPEQPLSAFELALQAGTKATDMEFFQYHPTALDLPLEVTVQIPRLPLITEAIRGAGALLKVGKNLMQINHEMGSLAPRDVVSRAVFENRQQGKRVYLDTSSIQNFSSIFPTIANICKQYDIDYNKIPIRTAVHYQIGGIKTDVNGRTCVDGLYVIGEASSTGLHGANRLASNSLLEASIMGKTCAETIQKSNIRGGIIKRRIISKKDSTQSTVRDINNRSLGIIRNHDTLKDAITTLSTLPQTPNVIASLMSNLFALRRTESVGSHYRSDYLETKRMPRQHMNLDEFKEEIRQVI